MSIAAMGADAIVGILRRDAAVMAAQKQLTLTGGEALSRYGQRVAFSILPYPVPRDEMAIIREALEDAGYPNSVAIGALERASNCVQPRAKYKNDDPETMLKDRKDGKYNGFDRPLEMCV